MKLSELHFSSHDLVISFVLLTAAFAAITSSSPSAVSQSLTTVTTYETRTNTVAVPATLGRYQCIYQPVQFYGLKDAQISGTIDSTSPIDFYIMTQADLNSWLSAGSCDVPSALVSQQGVTHYSFSLTIPEEGPYAYLFVNRSQNNGAIVGFSYPTPVISTTTVTPGLLPLKLGSDSTVIIVVVALAAALLGYFIGVRRTKARGK